MSKPASTPVRLSDYVATTLVKHGVEHVFLLTGGGAMHLNDALGNAEGLRYVCCHHEQALAMAAESYCRLSNKIACLNVTTGPGGINAFNGVFGAYTDSIGMIVISGQVKRETMRSNAAVNLRQLGDQEVDMVAMAKPITKMAEVVRNPNDIRYLLEKALYLATTGRPGPVWLDIPIDVQAAPIHVENLRGFDPLVEGYGKPFALPTEYGRLAGAKLKAAAADVIAKLKAAKRPVILPGTGVRISGAHDDFMRLIDRLGVPVAPGWNAQDIIYDDHPSYAGRPGTVGDRAGNFAVQNADFVLVLGCRLNIRQISYNWESFARAAHKVMVDIDTAEMSKATLNIDDPIHADLAEFIPALLAEADGYVTPAEHTEYLAWTQERRRRFPTVLPEYWDTKGVINPYCFSQVLFEELAEGDIVVMANATAAVVTCQAAQLKKGQRLYSNSGSASMGWDLPAAIGAWAATGGKQRIICIAGDGSIMQNLQELQTIVGGQMPIKIFLHNNSGYHSIRQSQQAFFPDHVVGCGPESGVTFPDFERLAHGFDIPYVRTSDHDTMRAAIRETLDGDGARICEVYIDKNQPFAPKLSSKKMPDGSMVTAPLEDLAPFLSREELKENMIIPTIN